LRKFLLWVFLFKKKFFIFCRVIYVHYPGLTVLPNSPKAPFVKSTIPVVQRVGFHTGTAVSQFDIEAASTSSLVNNFTSNKNEY
jgi:hypothetical protein